MPRLDYETPQPRLPLRRRLRPWVGVPAMISSPLCYLVVSADLVSVLIGVMAVLLIFAAAWTLWE